MSWSSLPATFLPAATKFALTTIIGVTIATAAVAAERAAAVATTVVSVEITAAVVASAAAVRAVATPELEALGGAAGQVVVLFSGEIQHDGMGRIVPSTLRKTP